MALLKDQDGVLQSVQDDLVPDLLTSGEYTQPSDAEASAYADEQARVAQHEAPLDVLKTFGESAASGATFGLSDLAESALLHNEKEHAEREKYSPVVAGLGLATGMVAPAVLTGGTSAVAKAAAATPAGLSAVAERALAKGLASGLEKVLPNTTGFVGSVLKRMASEGGAQALTGAEIGAQQVLHENALGDPNYTAEALLANPGKVVSEVGEGALFNGLLGAVIGGGGEALEKALPARDVVAGWLENKAADRILKAAGGIQKDVTRLDKHMSPAARRSMMLEMQDAGIVGTFNTYAGMTERAEEYINKGQTSARDAVTRADVAAQETNAARGVSGAGTDVSDIYNRVEGVASDLDKNYDTKNIASDLRARMDQWRTEVMPDGRASARDLWNLRQSLDSRIDKLKGFAHTDMSAETAGTALRDVRDAVTDAIQQRLPDTAAKEAWDTGMRQMQVGIEARRLARQGAARAGGNNAVSLTELMAGLAGAGVGGAASGDEEGALAGGLAGGVLAHVGRGAGSAAAAALMRRQGSAVAATLARGAAGILEPKAALLGALEKNNTTFLGKIRSDLSAILNSPTENALAAARPVTASLVDYQQEQDRKAAEFQRQAADLRNAANPQVLQHRLTELVGPWQEHAPATAASLTVAAARAANFLAGKLPQQPPPTPAEAATGKSTWQPTPQDMHGFNLYRDAALNPRGLLAQVRNGNITPQAVETVRTLYPATYDTLQREAMAALQEARGRVPERSRAGLELLLGRPLHGRGQTLGVARTLQAGYAAKNMPAMPRAVGKLGGEAAVSRLSLRPDSGKGRK